MKYFQGKTKFTLLRRNLVIGLVLFLFADAQSTLRARDAFVMLSGGVSPFHNNFSQYLQARAVAIFFEKNYPPDSVWTFFGAGNVEGKKPVLADVFCVTNRDGT